jgi:hypothetical protein
MLRAWLKAAVLGDTRPVLLRSLEEGRLGIGVKRMDFSEFISPAEGRAADPFKPDRGVVLGILDACCGTGTITVALRAAQEES